jgi:hypothetical protein
VSTGKAGGTNNSVGGKLVWSWRLYHIIPILNHVNISSISYPHIMQSPAIVPVHPTANQRCKTREQATAFSETASTGPQSVANNQPYDTKSSTNIKSKGNERRSPRCGEETRFLTDAKHRFHAHTPQIRIHPADCTRISLS